MKTQHSPSRKERPVQTATWLSRQSPLTQDLLCIGFLYLVLLVLFRGIIFSDSLFAASGDSANARAFIKAGDHIRETEHVDPLWMPYIFSGMPIFGNVAYIPHNVSYLQVAVLAVLKFLFLHGTVSWMIVHFFLGGCFTFLLMRTWGLSRLPSLFAALVFMLSPYAIGLAQEGHGSKLQALSYLPLVVLLTHLLLEKRSLLIFGLFSAGIGTLMLTNHMQIVYYVLVIVGLFSAVQILGGLREGGALAVKRAALVVAGVAIGFCIASYVYLSVYEYSHFSIRGSGEAGTAGGLSWDYATNWSFHPFEIVTFLIPSFFGFSSQSIQQWQGALTPLPMYWGTMPFVTSTAYAGILPILLTVIALVYRRNRIVLFFGALTVVLFLVSFGKHFGLLYGVLFNTLPFFDKFRAPVMILHLVAFTTAVMGGYGLGAVLEAGQTGGPAGVQGFRKGILTTLGILWALMIIGFLFKSGLYDFLSGFMFEKSGENYGAQTPQVIGAFKPLRFELLWGDFIKFVLLSTAGLGAIFLFLNRKLTETAFGAAVIVILLLDLFILDGKFINPVPQQEEAAAAEPTSTITFLKSQPGLFRVFPIGSLSSQEHAAPYTYHTVQSMMGYHPAKLKAYQEMIDSCLYRGPSSFPLNMGIVNMLNTRYLVVPGQLPPGMFELVHQDQANNTYVYRNPGALERAFFVDSVVVAQGTSAVYEVLNSPGFRPDRVAVVEKPLNGPAGPAAGAKAEVTTYASRDIVVKATTPASALLVLSEVYYPAGWKAFIDGTETEIYRTNAILRSVVVPAGTHTVEFIFDPPLYHVGWMLSNAAWMVCGICIVVGGAIEWKKRRQTKPRME